LAIHIGDLLVRTGRANIRILDRLDRLAEPVARYLFGTLGTHISEDIVDEQQGSGCDNDSKLLHCGQ
jgi:hypothetical protein